MSLKGCFSLIITRFIVPIIMALICVVVATFTTPKTAYMTMSLAGFVVFWPLLLYFLIAPFPIVALLKKLMNPSKTAILYKFLIAFIALLPFGLVFLSPTVFITAFVSVFLLMVVLQLHL